MIPIRPKGNLGEPIFREKVPKLKRKNGKESKVAKDEEEKDKQTDRFRRISGLCCASREEVC